MFYPKVLSTRSLYILAVLIVGIQFAAASDGGRNKYLLQQEISVAQFLESYDYHDKYHPVAKKLTQAVLGYVTPWNSHGYDTAKEFTSKLSHVSPVWFQIKPKTYEFSGTHDIDSDWIQNVRKGNKYVRIVPRIIFENWDAGDYQELISRNDARVNCIKAIRTLLKEHMFDGCAVEIWMQHYGTSQKSLIDFINELGRRLHVDNKILVLPIPPAIHKGGFEGRFNREHFDLLADNVDYFSLMTYDYSHSQSPGPNSPISWVSYCVKSLVPDGDDVYSKRAQILLGLNFYGYEFVPNTQSGRAVLGRDVIDVLKNYKAEFKWNEDSQEHSIQYIADNQLHVIFFPTPYSIAKRVALAETLGTGLSIWDIGQGFDSFFEQI